MMILWMSDCWGNVNLLESEQFASRGSARGLHPHRSNFIKLRFYLINFFTVLKIK